MRRQIRIRLLTIFITALIGLAIHSTAIGQTTGSAAIFPATQAASDCDARLKIALERLDKTLDAYEKATAALNAATGEIAARVKLDELKDQFIAVKDLIITEQNKLITLLQKEKPGNGVWAKIKQILSIAEKAALIAVGVYVGKGL